MARTLYRGLLALALTSTTLTAAHADPKVIKKVPPEFPEAATRRAITDGVLKVKILIDGQGAVTGVQVLEAVPASAKVFSDAAVVALNKWRFEASGKTESVELKLVFSQE